MRTTRHYIPENGGIFLIVRRVALGKTSDSEERTASIITVERIRELERTLAVTSN
jgi:hypothetical protein